jgi:hypothetical protein
MTSTAQNRKGDVVMTPTIQIDDQFLTVLEVADRLKLHPDSVRRLFLHEPGVVVLATPKKGRRVYRTIRIPVSVYRRVLTRLTRIE